jgi:TRAP-type C4-dicarboxylate transport system permease large subunit
LTQGTTSPLRPLLPLATLFILFANVLTLLVGIAPNFDTRIVDVGEAMWPGYAADLRDDPEKPDCDLPALQEQMKACPAGAAAPTAPTGGDPFGGTDPFADPATPPPAPPPAAPHADPFGGEDPFAAPAPKPAAPAPKPADPFAGEDPFAEKPAAPPAGDPFAGEDPFASAPPSAAPKVNCEALRSLTDRCASQLTAFDSATQRITPSVRAFRSVENVVSVVSRFRWWKHLLALVIVIGAASTTIHRVHISLRPAVTATEHVVSQLTQLVAYLLLAASCGFDWNVQRLSTAEAQDPALPVLFGVGFLALAVMNVVHLVRPPEGLTRESPSVGRILLVIPLFAYLIIISGTYFLVFEQHWSGLAIYLHKFIEYPNVYLGIALYVWAGMLLSETRVAGLMFDVASPWKLSPYLLAWLVAVISAVPTAYSGASGIFVISTGGVIFERLRAGGASRRVALGATAMSGSLGVVLRPCLIVVLIAVLNKQVTTEALFRSGFFVFLITAGFYFLAMMFRGESRKLPASPSVALGPSLQAVWALVPYAALAVVVLAFYAFAFKTWMNENTAPFVVPVLLLLLVVFDQLRAPPAVVAAPPLVSDAPPLREFQRHGIGHAVSHATAEASHNAGALLSVMIGSVAFGGIVERSAIMDSLPKAIGNPYLAMAVLVVSMIAIGMAMDALGAVILVSITLAPIAYASHIHPIHFWMMGLVAFELGYLHPPVGLNILLARQVVGREAEVERFPVEGGFFAKYEHVIVPCLVMAAALVIVAFVPLALPASAQSFLFDVKHAAGQP